jgi:predicted flap endonuclease-1-like 5' DNA nuclease
MRSDYALYTVAIIFFILTAIAAFAQQLEEKNLWVITTTVLGLLFIGLGYSQRPKATTIETPLPPSTTPATITEEQAETTIEAAPTVRALTEVKGIGEKRAKQLESLGINSTEDLVETSAKDLAAKLSVSPKITRKWIENARKLAEKS